MLAAVEITREFYAGWGTLSLINAGLAQGKGRSRPDANGALRCHDPSLIVMRTFNTEQYSK